MNGNATATFGVSASSATPAPNSSAMLYITRPDQAEPTKPATASPTTNDPIPATPCSTPIRSAGSPSVFSSRPGSST